MELKHMLVELDIDRVDLVPEGANSEAFIKIYKRKDKEADMTLEDILQGLPEDQRIIIEKAIGEQEPVEDTPDYEAIIAELKEELKRKTEKIDELETFKKEEEKEEATDEDILKSVDPAVKNLIEDLKAKAVAAEEFAKSLKEKEATEKAVSIAKSLKTLPADEETIVEVVKSADEKTIEILKAAAAALEESDLLKEKGSSAETQAASTTNEAWGKIEAAAADIAKSRNISKEAAVAVVIDEKPELYEEYTKTL